MMMMRDDVFMYKLFHTQQLARTYKKRIKKYAATFKTRLIPPAILASLYNYTDLSQSTPT